MSGFAAIKHQELPVKILKKFLLSGNLPGALLFSGPEGSGKRLAAEIFAMALNCREERGPAEDPCGRCSSCREIRKKIHPDISWVKPLSNSIRIDQVRNILHEMNLKPYNARHRVVIFEESHLLTTEASNAMLKTLEETSGGSVMLLITHRPADLLPTVLSRCHLIRFRPLTASAMAAILLEEGCKDQRSIHAAVALSGGSLEKARRILSSDDTGLPAFRDWVMGRMASLFGAPLFLVLDLAGKLSSDRAKAEEALSIMETWFRDMVVARTDPDAVINRDYLETIVGCADKLSRDKAILSWERIHKTGRMISGNANLRLVMEAMLLEISS